jgi:outer membrane lipoprotein SlyB
MTARVRIASLLAAASLLAVGCVTTHPLERPLTGEEIARLRDPVAGGTVTLLRQDPDPAVRGYEIKQRWPGAIGGLWIGLLAGAATGAAAGYAQGDDPPTAWIGLSAGEKAVTGAVVAGAVGGVVGVLVGALIGRTDRYVYAPAAESP